MNYRTTRYYILEHNNLHSRLLNLKYIFYSRNYVSSKYKIIYTKLLNNFSSSSFMVEYMPTIFSLC